MTGFVGRVLAIAVALSCLWPQCALAAPAFLRNIDLPGWVPYGIAIAPDGNLLVATQGSGAVLVVTPSGTIVRSFGSLVSAEVAVNAQGEVFVADHTGHRMLKYDAAGQLLASWSAWRPVGVSFDAQGYVWISEPLQNRLRRFTPGGQEVGQIVGAFLATPYGLEVAPDGTLLVANHGAPNFVRVSATGTLLATYPTSGIYNHGVFICGNGDILVTSAVTSRVEAFTASGASVYSLTGPGAGDTFAYDSVTDVAMSAEGMIYVVDRHRSRVCVFTDTRPTGVQVSSWGALKARFR